jgi:hypothetical protein
MGGTITYALWVHRWTREVFAVRQEGLRVTGICGPLPLSQVAPALCLALLPYDERPAALYRAQEYPEQFAMALAWLAGRDVPVGVTRPLFVRGLSWLAVWRGARDRE